MNGLPLSLSFLIKDDGASLLFGYIFLAISLMLIDFDVLRYSSTFMGINVTNIFVHKNKYKNICLVHVYMYISGTDPNKRYTIMKNLLILLVIAIMGLASCKKSESAKPTSAKIQYDVECKYCLVNVTDQYQSKKEFVVAGKWKYETEAGYIDSARIETYTSPYIGPVRVKSSISINGKIVAERDEEQTGNYVSYGYGLNTTKQ